MKAPTAALLAAIAAACNIPAAHGEILIGMPGPMTGGMAWFGEQMQEGIGMKVAELNAAGGVLGQPVEILPVDDFCDPDQATAAARRLVTAHVAAVIGHLCSGAAIPASPIYEEAGILLISVATNPKLTDQGFRTVFRITGRDTLQGTMAADQLVQNWHAQNIAIVHDGQAYGLGVADAARQRLQERGVNEVMFEAIEPGKTDYFDLIDQLQANGVDALFFGGYYAEAGLIIRQARSRGYDVRMIGPDTLNTEFFWREMRARACFFPPIASCATSPTPRLSLRGFGRRATSPRASRFSRTHQFDTLAGTIGFDAKGDVTGYEPFEWYIWKGGHYAPVDPTELAE